MAKLGKQSTIQENEMTDAELERATAPEVSASEIPDGSIVIETDGEDIEETVDVFPDEDSVDDVRAKSLHLDADDARITRMAHKLYPIRPRKTVQQTRICGTWYNFVEGKEIMVPGYVREWLLEQGIL